MLSDAFDWLLSGSEAIVSLVLILVIGAALAIVTFHFLYKVAQKLSGPHPEETLYEIDGETGIAEVIPPGSEGLGYDQEDDGHQGHAAVKHTGPE